MAPKLLKAQLKKIAHILGHTQCPIQFLLASEVIYKVKFEIFCPYNKHVHVSLNLSHLGVMDVPVKLVFDGDKLIFCPGQRRATLLVK